MDKVRIRGDDDRGDNLASTPRRSRGATVFADRDPVQAGYGERWQAMTSDPLSREAALERVKEAGRKAGAWGGPKDANPYARSPSMHAESAAWLAGHAIGAAERKRKP